MYIVKVPGINGLGKTNGCEKAGNVIIESLREIYTNEQGKPIDVRLLDLEEIHLDNGNLEQANFLIYKNALEMLEEKPKTFFVGGDHSISFSLTKAFLDYSKKQGKEPCLIIFDAHPDLMQPVHKDTPTHEEWLRAIIEQGFPAENILLVGVRNADSQELTFLNKNKIKTININHLITNLEDTCDTIIEFSNGKELYLSLDIDVIDPAFAPGTGYLEPGGLTSRQFLYLVQRLNKIKSLRAIDLVEINPEKDKENLTVKLGSKILSELL